MTLSSKVIVTGYIGLFLIPFNVISQVKVGLGSAYGIPVQNRKFNDDIFRETNTIGFSPFLDIEYNFAAGWEVQASIFQSSYTTKFQSIKSPPISFNTRSNSIDVPITVARSFDFKGLRTALRMGIWTSKDYKIQQYGVTSDPFSSTITIVNGQYTETLKLINYRKQLDISNKYRLGLISGVSTIIPFSSKLEYCIGIDYIFLSQRNNLTEHHFNKSSSSNRLNPYFKISYKL